MQYLRKSAPELRNSNKSECSSIFKVIVNNGLFSWVFSSGFRARICCRRPKCTAKLSILIKDPIKTERTSSSYTFSPNVTEEMLMNPENYNTVSYTL